MKEKNISYLQRSKQLQMRGGAKEEAATSKKVYILLSFRKSFAPSKLLTRLGWRKPKHSPAPN